MLQEIGFHLCFSGDLVQVLGLHLHSTCCSVFACLQVEDMMLPSCFSAFGHPQQLAVLFCVIAVKRCRVLSKLVACHWPACCDLVLLYFVSTMSWLPIM